MFLALVETDIFTAGNIVMAMTGLVAFGSLLEGIRQIKTEQTKMNQTIVGLDTVLTKLVIDTTKLAHLEQEVDRLRDWRHDMEQRERGRLAKEQGMI